MADNPYANRPKSDKKTKQCPLDMPQGDSGADKAARQRYWVRVGNEKLVSDGKGHLEWKATDGHYWIEPR